MSNSSAPPNSSEIFLRMERLGSEYQIHLTREPDSGRDHMRLVIERAQGVTAARDAELLHEVGHQIKKQLLVTAELELIDYGALPRSERKSQRVFDTRLRDEIV